MGVHDNDNYDIYNSHISNSLIFKLRVPAVNTDTLTYPTNTKKKNLDTSKCLGFEEKILALERHCDNCKMYQEN